MSESAAAIIRIGGALPRALFAMLEAAIEADHGRLDWNGNWFSEESLSSGEPLELVAREASGGQFETVESFCIEHRLPFARWCESRPTEWDAARIVYSGEGRPLHFLATDDDEIAVTASEIERLGSIEAIRGWLNAADAVIPPFRIVDALPAEPIDLPEDIADFPAP